MSSPSPPSTATTADTALYQPQPQPSPPHSPTASAIDLTLTPASQPASQPVPAASSSSTSSSFNKKNTGIKRILSELKELQSSPSPDFTAAPLEDNLFEWHFTLAGPVDTPFHGGRYHGRIILPADYPFKPPSIMLLTPSGRFEVGKKICLTITGYHPEFWQPAWGIRTAMVAIISFFPTKSEGAIGGLDWTDEERQKLALKSLEWQCPTCGVCMRDAIAEIDDNRDDQQHVDVSMFKLSYAKESTVSVQSTTDQVPLEVPPDVPAAVLVAPQNNYWMDAAIVVLIAIVIMIFSRRILEHLYPPE